MLLQTDFSRSSTDSRPVQIFTNKIRLKTNWYIQQYISLLLVKWLHKKWRLQTRQLTEQSRNHQYSDVSIAGSHTQHIYTTVCCCGKILLSKSICQVFTDVNMCTADSCRAEQGKSLQFASQSIYLHFSTGALLIWSAGNKMYLRLRTNSHWSDDAALLGTKPMLTQVTEFEAIYAVP